jgi:nicotinate-nucleotide adenylyltransferase
MNRDSHKKKIVVFGSAVNPVTRAHRALAEVLTHAGEFDLVLFLPSGLRPDKPHLIDPMHRVRMAELAFHDDWRAAQPTEFRIDLREAFRPSIPTAYLLRELHAEHPDADIIFATGVDVLTPKEEYGGKCDVLHYWEEGESMLRERTFAVIPRDGYPDPHTLKEQGHIPPHFIILPSMPLSAGGISSTEIRRRILDGLSVDDLVDEKVAQYIHENGLYRTTSLTRNI